MKLILALLLVFSTTTTFAYDADESFDSYEDYDSIVGDLSSSTSVSNGDELLNLDKMKLHAGFGFNNTIMDLKSKPNSPESITLQGFQISLGIDLFSPNTITEVGLINYNSEFKENNTYKLREFDIKTYYRHHLNSIIGLRGGAGLGIRYIDIDSPTGSIEYTNPVAQILVGGEAKLGRKLSFITELSYKKSMTSDAPENAATDLTFRVDGHF